MNGFLRDYINIISKKKGERDLLTRQRKDIKDVLLVLKQDSLDLEEAQIILQIVAKETQEQLKYHITDIVQLAIDACFPNEYIFDINFEIKRGKTEAYIVFKKNGHDIDPLDDSGGGVVDLASFALRIAAWSLGKTDSVIILDEPFRFLSKDLQPQAAEIMKQISEKLKLQFIMVTHNKDIVDCSDRVFEVAKDGEGVSYIRRRK